MAPNIEEHHILEFGEDGLQQMLLNHTIPKR